jgi:hypothetical protein
MSSSVGCTIAAFNGAKYAAPYVKNNLSQSAQEAVGVFFGGNSPTVQFQPQAFGQETGPLLLKQDVGIMLSIPFSLWKKCTTINNFLPFSLLLN